MEGGGNDRKVEDEKDADEEKKMWIAVRDFNAYPNTVHLNVMTIYNTFFLSTTNEVKRSFSVSRSNPGLELSKTLKSKF